MSEVKRYDMRVSLGGVESYESPCGDYVDYDDYAALEAKCAKMAAENAGLKSKGREVLNEACNVYDKFNANVDSDCGDFMDGQTLHEFQFVLDVETTATDAFLAEIEHKAIASSLTALNTSYATSCHRMTPKRCLRLCVFFWKNRVVSKNE